LYYDQKVTIFYKEQISIPSSHIFVGNYEGALFALPASISNIDTSFLAPKLISLSNQRANRQGEIAPYIYCSPSSALYPYCLTGAHEIDKTSLPISPISPLPISSGNIPDNVTEPISDIHFIIPSFFVGILILSIVIFKFGNKNDSPYPNEVEKKYY